MKKKAYGFFFALLWGASAMIGCADFSLLKTMGMAKVWLETIRLTPAEDVNGNTPVTVDVLIFYQEEGMEKITALTAEQYFSRKKQLMKDYGDQIECYSYEVVPGAKPKNVPIHPSRSSGLGGVVFAQYSTPGPHRHIVGPDRFIQIDLEKDEFTIKVLKS